MKFSPAKLRDALARRDWNQADLARATGWSEPKVSRFIRGIQGDVTLTSISELARALNVSEAELVDLEDVAQTDEEKEHLRNFRAAAERDKRIAKEAVKPHEQG